MKKNNTPGGFALGHASGDGNGWVHWCLWSHGGNTVDKNDKVIINSPETAKALEYAKALYAEMIPGVASWNDASNNKAFLAGEINWTDNGISIYVAAKKDATKKQIAEDMDHAYWPVGPIGKPTELHLMYPVMAMTYTKYPQACKALMAFMLEADNFNPWIQSAKGYLTHCLNAYDKNPIWTADPKNTVFGERRQADADRGRARLGRREGGDRDCRLRRARHVRELLHRPRRREGLDRDRRAAVEAHLSLDKQAGGSSQACPPAISRCKRTSGSQWRLHLEQGSTKRVMRDATAWERLKTNRNWLAFWFMLPAAAFLILFLAYPLGLGVWLSFTDARIGRSGVFVGLENYEWLWDDSTFWLSVFNTLLYTSVASTIKFAVGLYLALLLNERLPFKAIIRAVVLIPFIVPTVLSAIAFWWLFDPQFSIISWSLKKMGLITANIDFLGDIWNARWSVIFANIWRGVPFVAITLLAGLQTVSPSLYEAATIDGATSWQRFRFITYPLLTPIIAVVMTFSVLFTFTDFQLIWVMTRGGPVNATHLMATLSYQRAILGGQLGEGAAISTAMIPFLLAAILVSWFGLQRRKWQQGESND